MRKLPTSSHHFARNWSRDTPPHRNIVHLTGTPSSTPSSYTSLYSRKTKLLCADRRLQIAPGRKQRAKIKPVKLRHASALRLAACRQAAREKCKGDKQTDRHSGVSPGRPPANGLTSRPCGRAHTHARSQQESCRLLRPARSGSVLVCACAGWSLVSGLAVCIRPAGQTERDGERRRARPLKGRSIAAAAQVRDQSLPGGSR
ncbi:unnamed protein product, partial [Protopolystoma xenopodis]